MFNVIAESKLLMCVCVCARARARVCVHARARACMCVCVRLCLCLSVFRQFCVSSLKCTEHSMLGVTANNQT